MVKKVISPQNREYFKFIDELRKHAKLVETKELSRMYAEVADLLSEAFDEYNPEDLPKYQRRLESIIRFSQNESELGEPVFQSDLRKAEKVLGDYVTQRFGTFKKIATLADATVRGLRNTSAFVDDFISLTDDAANAGRRFQEAANSFFGSFSFGRRGKLSNEEQRNLYDVLKGTNEQPQSSASVPVAQSSQLPTTTDGNVPIKVQDEPLRAINSESTKLLTKLFEVTKDTNADIKQIKGLLTFQARDKDDRTDAQDLNRAENNIESGGKAVVAGKSFFKDLTGKDVAVGGGPGSGKNDSNLDEALAAAAGGAGGIFGTKVIGQVLSYLWKKGKDLIINGIKKIWEKVIPWIGRKAIPTIARGLLATVMTAVSSPAVLTAAGISAGVLGALYVAEKVNEPIKEVLSAGASSIGEKLHGIDYYKNVLKDENLEEGSQERAERHALNYLKKDATSKRELFEESYKDNSEYGNGKYKINDKPATKEEALADVKAAEDHAKEYEEYLRERDKKGKLNAYAKVNVNGKVISNPLYSQDETDQIYADREAARQKELEAEKQRNQMLPPSPIPAPTPDAYFNEEGKLTIRLTPNRNQPPAETDTSKTTPSPVPAPSPGIESAMRVLGAAETGPLTANKDLDHPDRFIRTGAGSISSAYGPLQITQSLAKGGLKNNWFERFPDLKEWIEKKFLPQSRKFMGSSYSDPKYGADGKGDLHGDEDKKSYMQMAKVLVENTLKENDNNIWDAAAEWRYGKTKMLEWKRRHPGGNMLKALDPKYADKMMRQMGNEMESLKMPPSRPEVARVSDDKTQLALNNLSKEYDKQKMQPAVVAIPTPAPQVAAAALPAPVTSRSVGAASNGASDSSLMMAMRQCVSPVC